MIRGRGVCEARIAGTLVAVLALVGCDKPENKAGPVSGESSPSAPSATARAPFSSVSGGVTPLHADPAVPQASTMRELAKRVLDAHRAKDGQALVALVPPKDRPRTRKEILPGGAARETYFGDRAWRSKVVAAWDGGLHEVRMRKRRVRVRFGKAGEDRAAVVELLYDEGAWYFQDIKRPFLVEFWTWGRALGGSTAAASNSAPSAGQ